MTLPVRPAPRYIMKGIDFFFQYPGWMWDDYYKTESGVAISADGRKTHPKRLSAEQAREVEEFKSRHRIK